MPLLDVDPSSSKPSVRLVVAVAICCWSYYCCTTLVMMIDMTVGTIVVTVESAMVVREVVRVEYVDDSPTLCLMEVVVVAYWWLW